MPDVETTCVQCKETFLFTEKEQETFYQRNLAAPQRCLKCRSKKAVAGDNAPTRDRKSTRLNSSHIQKSRMPSSA